MKFTNPWNPEDSDRLIWQALTLAIDAVLSLRIVRDLLAVNPFAEIAEAASPAAPKPKRKRHATT
jgi:hypothetical protein